MRVRVRFEKTGSTRFLGHLDVMRYFQKAVRRSGLPIKYSQGFNPHQLMVFAQPLGVGVTSDGEYMDIETEDVDFNGNELNAERAAGILGSALTEGFEIVSIREIPWTEGTKHPENAMSLVGGADYMMSLKDGYELKKKNAGQAEALSVRLLKDMLKDFMKKGSIVVSKKSKSGEKEMDIRPYIYEAEVEDNSGIPEFMYGDSKARNSEAQAVNENGENASSNENKCLDGACIGIAHADVYLPGIRFFFRLSAGSAVNIKPELVLGAFLESYGIEYEELAFQIHRANMFLNAEDTLGL